MTPTYLRRRFTHGPGDTFVGLITLYAEGQLVVDHDLPYVYAGLLFMGAEHVDGTPFDRPGNRPHQVQLPRRHA